jgi:hypothetical protein
MTEDVWLACTNLESLLRFLRGRTSDRKLRLFAAACCRRIWHLFKDVGSRNAVEVFENFAEGLATAEELAGAIAEANDTCDWRADEVSEADAEYSEDRTTYADYANAEAAYAAAYPSCFLTEELDEVLKAPRSVCTAVGCDAEAVAYFADEDDFSAKVVADVARQKEEVAQIELLRHIVGNPFRPVTLDTSILTWNDATIPALLSKLTDDQSSVPLPILADALEDAGFDNAEILSHLRGPGPHVRGCWVLDLLLGKE